MNIAHDAVDCSMDLEQYMDAYRRENGQRLIENGSKKNFNA
jgi:hypothetical protein